MNPQNIKSLLKEIFHDIAPEIEFDKLNTALSLRDQVEIDSFDFYRILVKINQKTGIYVPDSKVTEFKNMDQLIDYISKQQAPSAQLS